MACCKAWCCLALISSSSLSDSEEASDPLSWAKAAAFSSWATGPLWPPLYLYLGPPLIMATLPDLTLAFSSKVSLTFCLSILAIWVVLVFSWEFSVLTISAAYLTWSSKTFLLSSGVSLCIKLDAGHLWYPSLWSTPPLAWILLSIRTSFFWFSA